MKQKIVIKTRITCEKCKIKAMQTVAKASPGLISIEVQGNEVVVKGDGVDCITLTSALRKKLGWAYIVSVEGEQQNKPAPASTEPEAQAPSTPLAARSIISPIPCHVPYYPPCSPYPEFYVCERLSPDPCSIL